MVRRIGFGEPSPQPRGRFPRFKAAPRRDFAAADRDGAARDAIEPRTPATTGDDGAAGPAFGWTTPAGEGAVVLLTALTVILTLAAVVSAGELLVALMRDGAAWTTAARLGWLGAALAAWGAVVRLLLRTVRRQIGSGEGG